MDSESILNVLFILLGVVSLIAAFMNWDWVFKRQYRAGFIRMLDNNGARVINFMFGLLLLLVGSFDYFFPLLR